MNKLDNKKINISGPSITQKEIDYVTEAVREAWYSKANYYNDKFENDFKEYVGTKYAVCLPSCTAAIHLALASLNIGHGDEVIVPDSTWIASVAPVTYVGATPVFADVDEDTWCITPESFKKNITSKTRAVIVVDLYGNIPEMDEIRKIAKDNNVAIIEDAAESHGCIYKGRKTGSLGDIGVFSFHGSKLMTTGEGGMLVTDNEDVYKRCLKLRDHGKAAGEKMFWNDEVGFKYKMSSMQAALGLAQLERIEELVETKRRIFGWYESDLKGIEGLKLNCEPDGTRNNYWMVTIVWDTNKYKIDKERMLRELRANNIEARPFFYPLSMLPAFKYLVGDKDYSKINPVAYKLSNSAVNLPCGMSITREDVGIVCEKVKEILK